MKRLIVNADDFGLTTEVNRGIVQCFNEGILTSTSLIASGEGFEDAIRLARENPALDVGVHLTLVGERSVLPSHEIPTLVDSHNRFRSHVFHFTLDYLRQKISREEVEKEFRAQIDKIIDSGIGVSHIDSHQHVHVLPDILDVVIDLAQEYGVGHIRRPTERVRFTDLVRVARLPRVLQQAVLYLVCSRSRAKLAGYAPDHFLGFYDAGNLDKESLLRLLRAQEAGISEVGCHPGAYCDGSTRRKYSHWNYHWEDEVVGLVDGEVRDYLHREGIRLVSFADIGPA